MMPSPSPPFHLDKLVTPCVLLDKKVATKNAQDMLQKAANLGCELRPVRNMILRRVALLFFFFFISFLDHILLFLTHKSIFFLACKNAQDSGGRPLTDEQPQIEDYCVYHGRG